MATDVQTESVLSQDGQDAGMERKKLIAITVGSAIAAGIVCVAIATARQGWLNWRLELVGIDLAVAVVASFLANLVKGMDERGAAWASAYVSPDDQSKRALYHVLSILPSVAVRAAIIAACLAAFNATIVMTMVFREAVVLPPLAVIIRFLADIPQVFAICLVVRLLVDRHVQG